MSNEITNFQIKEVREATKLIAPTADFDAKHTFFYDETNNLKKFYVRENDFNVSFTANFVLGGLVFEGDTPNVDDLIASFRLQKTAKEVKFKHIAKGEFLDCLKSPKLKLFLDYINKGEIYIHYSSLNILYWSIVDIVDSAIINLPSSLQFNPFLINHLKNDLYKLARFEIDSVIELFYYYEYPNIKHDYIVPFVDDLISLFDEYIETSEFHFGLETLRQVLKEAKKSKKLPFITDEEDHLLLKDLSQFYLRPIYLFKNSNHIFDNEDSISKTISSYKILDDEEEINNFSFVDSESSPMVQLSDVFVGLMGKLMKYFNTNSYDQIAHDISNLSELQGENLDLLIAVIDKSHNKNIGFIHNTNSLYEISKMDKIIEIRNSI